jgi:hypothetical protein
MKKPLCIDLGCGKGGWAEGFLAEGYHVIGFDIVNHGGYPGEMVLQDVRTIEGTRFRGAAVIVASMPCDQFTRHQMPWTKRRNPPEPDLSLVEACWRIAGEAGVPFVMENVRMAQKWLGQARAHFGSRYLWGDVPALLPWGYGDGRHKESMSSTWKAERAKVPLELSRWIAEVYKPERRAA